MLWAMRAPAEHLALAIDADRVAPRLYQGGAPPEGGALRYLGIDTLVLAAEEHQPPSSRFPGVEVVHAPYDDAQRPLSQRDWQTVRAASRRAAIRIQQGKRVLVTCAMGLNRSGLIVALTLLRLVPPQRLSAEDAVRHVKLSRPGALRNPYFVQALLAIR